VLPSVIVDTMFFKKTVSPYSSMILNMVDMAPIPSESEGTNASTSSDDS